jgi:anaerobic ribonucleoside-triphosphate reductase activating protein
MKIAKIINDSKIYGPKNRMVIWTQGCSIRCKGCWNKDLWDMKGGEEISIKEIISRTSLNKDIEGITILGGEPFDQHQELFELTKQAKEKGLTVMVFTGFDKEDLKHTSLEYIDILITGKYIETLRNTSMQWIGSTNQKILFLTNVYSEDCIENANYVEIEIDEYGKKTIVGFPETIF